MEETIFQELRRRDKWDVLKDDKGVKKITLQHHVKDIVGNRNWGKSVFDSALDILEGENRIISFPGDFNRPAFKFYRLLRREDPIWIQKEARIRQQQQIRNQSASINPPSNAMQDDDGDTTMQVNDERPEETDHDDDGGVLSEAMPPGVASPVDPDSVIAMEVDNQDVAASRRAEQWASEEADNALTVSEDHGSSSDELSAAMVPGAPEVPGVALVVPGLGPVIPGSAPEDEDLRENEVMSPADDAPKNSDSDQGSSDDDPSVHPEDNPDHDNADETSVVVPPVVPLVADDNPLYQAAQRPNLFDQMEKFLRQFDEFDIRSNEGRGGGVVTQPPTSHVLERFGRFLIADVTDKKGNMDGELLLKKVMQIKNDLLIPIAERNAIVKAIEYHIDICALAVAQSVEKRRLGRLQFFALYKRQGWERHHIVPRSCDGTNDDVNLVYLSTTDHIMVHGHLSVMCNDPVLSQIFCFMTSSRRCAGLTETIDQVQQLLNDEGLLEELAISRSIYSTLLKNAHEKKRTGAILDEFETKVIDGWKRAVAKHTRNRINIIERVRSGDLQLESITPTDYSHMKAMVLMRQGRRNWDEQVRCNRDEQDEQVWWEKYALFHLFSTNERHSNVINNPDNTAKYPDLADWIAKQLAMKVSLESTQRREEFDALDNAGMIWDLDKHYWERDLKLLDRYFEKYADDDPPGYSTVVELRKYVVDGSLDDGFESDGQEVKLGEKIHALRRRIAYQCWDTNFNDRREEPIGSIRNKHLNTTMDLTPSQIKDLIRVNFTIKCGGWGTGMASFMMPLNDYLERRHWKKIDYRYAVPNNYK